MEIEVTIIGIEKVVQILDAAADDNTNKQIIKEAADAVISRARRYPSPSRRNMKFVSAKQRKFFFAALREGRITVPYRRSGGLASNWRLASNNGREGDIENNKVYSKFVMGSRKDQAAYHKGTWPTVEKVADESEADAALATTAVLVEKFRRLGGI